MESTPPASPNVLPDSPNNNKPGERPTGEHPSRWAGWFHRLLPMLVPVLALGTVLGIAALFHLDQFVEELEWKTYDLRAQLPWSGGTHQVRHDIVILQFDDVTL